jgi:hypothetical protein
MMSYVGLQFHTYGICSRLENVLFDDELGTSSTVARVFVVVERKLCRFGLRLDCPFVKFLPDVVAVLVTRHFHKCHQFVIRHIYHWRTVLLTTAKRKDETDLFTPDRGNEGKVL